VPNTLDTMDSLNISSNQRDHPIATGRSFRDAWKYWRCFVTPEPISNGLREMIRLDLRKQWYSDRLQKFRFWTLTNWARIDSEKILLDSDVSNIDSYRKASFFCNRPSAFYWLQSIQKGANGDRHVTPMKVFATIFGEWYRQYVFSAGRSFAPVISGLTGLVSRFTIAKSSYRSNLLSILPTKNSGYILTLYF